MKNKIIFLITFLVFLNGCQTIKDGLSGNKQENSDEFLVEKKNPLELPPEYGDLPVPKSDEQNDKSKMIDEEIEKLVKNSSESNTLKTNDKSAEDFVLKKINKN